jgi:hypothetical protein
MEATQSWKNGLSGFGSVDRGGLNGWSKTVAVHNDGIDGAGVLTGCNDGYADFGTGSTAPATDAFIANSDWFTGSLNLR